MNFTEVIKTFDVDTAVIDVLFVTNQHHIPSELREFLDSRHLLWGRVAVSEFSELVQDLKVIGTIVVDTTEVGPGMRRALLETLTTLEQQNCATILLNDEIGFPFADFRLATLLNTASSAEIAGRIEANVAWYHSLRRTRRRVEEQPATAPLPGATHDQPNDVAADTAEQLRMAGEVQKSFLPKELPNSDQLRWAVLFRPADWVSGDIYDVRRLDEQHIGFYIADAVGHSMPAALLTMFLKQAMIMRETHGNQYRIYPPSEVIARANTTMAQQELAGCLFATCCYGLLNVRTMQMTLARAGHPYPVVIRADAEPVQLESRGGLLGVFADSQFEEKILELHSGDKVFLYSDGCESLVGQCDDQHVFRFTEAFRSIAHLPAEELIQRFDELNRGRRVPAPERDDVTAIALEVL